MRVRRVDDNQPALVEQIRKIPGVSVALTHRLGNGFVDAVIGHKGLNYLAEIKDPAKSKSRKKLTADEEKFHASWRGQVAVIETIDDVLKMLNITSP